MARKTNAPYPVRATEQIVLSNRDMLIYKNNWWYSVQKSAELPELLTSEEQPTSSTDFMCSEQTKHFQSTEPLHPAQSHNPLLLHSEWDSTTVPHTRSLSPFCSLMSCLVLMMQTFVDAPFVTHRDLLTLRKSNSPKTVDMTGRLRRPCRSVLYLSRREKRCRLLREREGTVTGSWAISVKWIWVFSSCLSAVKNDLHISEYAEEWRINLTHAFTNNKFFLHFL